MNGVQSPGGRRPLPSSLRIHFAKGERPHLFWVSSPDTKTGEWVKILSKRRADATIEVLVVRAGGGLPRRVLAHLEIPVDTPSGWLSGWVDTLARDLDARFHAYDLRSIDSAAAWTDTALRIGWLRDTRGGRAR